MRLPHGNSTTNTKPKTRLSKDQERQRAARRMALWCGGITAISLGLGVVWARYKIVTAGYVHIPIVFLPLWLGCLGFTVWSVYEWRHR